MGDALSKETVDEPVDAALPVAAPAAALAPAAAPATVNRRRVKGTPTRVITAANSGSGGSGGISGSKGRKGAKRKKKKAEPAAASPPAHPDAEAPAPAAVEAAATPPAAGPPAPPAVVIPRAGCKRKVPEPSDSPHQDGGLAKRQQLLGLAILTMGALTGMAPFALPRRTAAAAPAAGAAAAEAEPKADMEEAAAEEEQAAAAVPGAAAAAVQAAQPAAAEMREVAAAAEPQSSGGIEQQAAAQQRAPANLPAAAASAAPAACQSPAPAGSPESEPSAADLAQQQQQTPAVERQQHQQHEQQQQLADEQEPACTPLPAPLLSEQLEPGAGEATPVAAPPPRPLSAAKLVSRSQLRQQLLQSQRTASAGSASPALRFARRSAAGTPPTSAAHSTREQRLLGLAHRQLQHAHAAAAEEAPLPGVAPAAAAAAVEDGEQMQLDQPDAAAAVHAEQPCVSAAQPAQRRLTQSPLRRPLVPGDSTTVQLQQEAEEAAKAAVGAEEPTAAASPCKAVASPQPPPADSAAAATPQPQRSTPPTPLTADPGSTPRPALGAALGMPSASPISPVAHTAAQQPCSSSVQSPVATEGAVQAALRKIGALLVDLRGDSPQAPRMPRAGPASQERAACPGAGQGTDGSRPAERATASAAAARGEDEAQSALKRVPSPPPQQQPPGAASPRSPPEVCSRPQEAGADNFPGFWRQPALGRSGVGAAGTAGTTAGCTPAKARKRPLPGAAPAGSVGAEGALEEQPPGSAAGRERRVRFGESKLVCFSLPEPDEATEGASGMPACQQQQQQQPSGGPAPLVVAPPVLPGGGSGFGEGRPATPAKPAHLPMPQPPAYLRFGTAAFRRAYSGPQGRRQALLSFVSEGGATCYALAPGPPPASEAEGGDGSAELQGGGHSSDCGGLLIPRRLQQREGLRRRSLLPALPSPQGPALLEQEVREAFMNAKLAGHLMAGEAWARLDMAGCELVPGGGHAEALAQLSSRLEQAQGPGAVRQLLEQLDTEWRHLKRLRQYATQGAAAAAAAAAAGEGEEAGPGAGGGRPRGILKHRSSLGGSGAGVGSSTQPGADAGGGVAARAELPAAEQPVAEQPAQVQPGGQPAAAAQTQPAEQPPEGPAEQPAGQPAKGPAERPTERPGPGAAGGPASFEAVLAATIVQELPAAPSAPVAATAAPPAVEAAQPTPVAAPAQGDVAAEATAACSPQDEAGPAPMDVDAAPAPDACLPTQAAVAEPGTASPAAAAVTVAAAAAAAAAAASEPELGAEQAPAGTPQQAAAAAVGAEEQAGPGQEQAAAAVGAEEQAGPGQEQLEVLSLEPRPVELTPGPQLSRGAKLLQRCTPTAAGKVQQLLQGVTGHGRKAAAAPYVAPMRVLSASGGGLGAGGPTRRGMSRGERLLASLRGTACSGTATASSAARTSSPAAPGEQPGGGAVEGSPLQAQQMPEEGPTVAPAAAVLLGS
ncbi:hypothetical protein ABPG75_001270 [Micractinium tetrahymenae]